MYISLTHSQVIEAQQELTHWTYDRDRRALYRRIEKKDFSQAFGLMARIALEAEKMDHHPEWSNVYNRIDVWLTTHTVQSVSDCDVAMARFIDTIVED